MSFILDALRKSEHARQRQTGPGLAEVPVAPARIKTNVWATAAVALLVVNLVAVGVLLLRRAQQAEAPVVATQSTATTAVDTQGPTATVAQANPTLTPPAPATTPTPAITQSATPPPVKESPRRNPLADELGDDGSSDPGLRAAAAAVPAGPPAVVSSSTSAKRGSVIYAPVPEADDAPYVPPPPPQPVAQPAARQPAAETLPGADEITARGGMPALHLDLHVYATQAQQRFVFVNSRKYQEGDTLAEGPVIERIVPDGAVLNFRGSRFKLSND